MATIAESQELMTFGDLLQQLGNVPAKRVLLRPAPGTATEADVLAAASAPRKRLCELVDGVLVEKAMGYDGSALAAELISLLLPLVQRLNLGIVTGESGMVRLFPGLVRIPDVAFASWDRFPGRRRAKKPIPDLVPDLVVEVLSPSNTRGEMRRKRHDYFSAGVHIVWEIDPRKRTVSVYTSEEPPLVLTQKDTLDGGEVLPGFSLKLAQLFAELDRDGVEK